ncbi:MAG: (2Fe-2S) ferredoxin domain-containing protein, partial [Caldilineae bacterium]
MREHLEEIKATEEEAARQYARTLHVCTAAGCLSSGAGELKAALEKEVERAGLERWCQVKGVGCLGLCAAGPLVAVEPEGALYAGVSAEQAFEMVEALEKAPLVEHTIPADSPFFQRQTRIVLENA